MSPATAAARKEGAPFAKGDQVVLAVPTGFAKITYTGILGTNRKFDIDAQETSGVVEIKDNSKTTGAMWRQDWRTAGFPSPVTFTVKNVKTVGRPTGKFWELSLHAEPYMDWRVFVPADEPQLLRTLVAPAAAEDSVRHLAYDSLGALFFTGPLASFTPEERTLLLTFAHLTANSTRISSEVYKGVTYLVLTLPGDGNTWNDLRVTRSERVGHLIGDAFPTLKAFARVAVRKEALGGLKIEQPSRHGTAPDYTDTRNDDVHVYVPLDALLKFADNDITNQTLVSQSIVLVNGDRIEINLTTQ